MHSDTRLPRLLKIFGALVVASLAFGAVSCTQMKPKAKASGGLLDSSYYVKAYKPNNPANVRVKVSLANQAIYVMEGERNLMAAACTVGMPSAPTPRGNFRIYSKQMKRRRQSEPGRGYPMGYWCEFQSAYGIHAGWVHNVPRSHGCIRLHFNVAPKFFNLVSTGTPVNIAQSQPEDATIGRSITRPRDSNNPEFPSNILMTDEVFNIYKGPLTDG